MPFYHYELAELENLHNYNIDMYLARLQTAHGTTYQLRFSYAAQKCYQHKTIFDFGLSPTEFFEIQNRTVIFSNALLKAVKLNSSTDPDLILEEILFDFFPTHIQRNLTNFRTHKDLKFGPLSADEKEAITTQIHLFDRKRLYYLRYGAVDQSRLSKLHDKCCRPLLGMSRDEKEYYFREEEKALEPGMYMQYVYSVFDLQRHFSQSFASWMPEALQLDEIADHFVDDICKLNQDQSFWNIDRANQVLHHHLARYLIMFFDYAATPRSFLDDFTRSFQDQYRSFKWPDKKTTNTPEEITEIFGVSYEKLKKMSKEELSKTYRKKAMQLHPDQGGSDELFIKLTNAYEQLKKA